MIYIIYLLRLNKNHTTKKNLTFFHFGPYCIIEEHRHARTQ